VLPKRGESLVVAQGSDGGRPHLRTEDIGSMSAAHVGTEVLQLSPEVGGGLTRKRRRSDGRVTFASRTVARHAGRIERRIRGSCRRGGDNANQHAQNKIRQQLVLHD
jgi:hypothetical protein